MYGSNRSTGTSALGAQQPEKGDGAQPTSARNKEGRQPNQSVPLPPKEPAHPSEAVVTKRQTQTEQPAPHELRDLAAQEDMAFWAMLMFVAAVATFIVTSFGTFLIWSQVKLTRRAVEDTGEATEAMRDANVTSNQMLQAEISPFLVVRPIDGDKIRWSGSGFTPSRVYFKIENVGRGPAIVTAIHREWQVCPKNQYPEAIDPTRPQEMEEGPAWRPWFRKPVRMTIGSSSSSHELDSFSDDFERESPNVTDTSWIFFIGYVEFEDLAGNRYASGFLHILRQDIPDRGLHLALPEKRASEYNYQKPLTRDGAMKAAESA